MRAESHEAPISNASLTPPFGLQESLLPWVPFIRQRYSGRQAPCQQLYVPKYAPISPGVALIPAPSSKCPHCKHRIVERFVPGQVVHESCDIHVEVAIDPRTGGRAGPACHAVEREVREAYPPRYASWAEQAGRPVVPASWSSFCPGTDELGTGRPEVAYPFEGARFTLDPALPASQQAIVLRGRAPSGTERVRFLLDGRVVATARAPFSVAQPLSRGRHEVVVETLDGRRSAVVTYTVE